MFGSKKQKTSEPEQIIKTERNPDPDDMISHYDDVSAKLEQVLAKLEVSEDRHRDNEEKIKSLTENLTRFQSIEVPLPYNDITTELTSGDQIQLDSYKVIPEFSGNQKNYRSWREQVVRRMNLIENFKKHPKYEAALGIIRAKIIDTASDILINNNTKYNIDAIIERLDFSYADQRPLYVVEAEMTTIKQGGMTLQEYHDNINRALNMVITKIVMTYRHPEEQKSLTNEMQQKAVRTFIIGLKSATTRSILYGQSPKSLSAAFAIAQTVYYDNQYLQLEHKNEPQRIQTYPQQQPTPAKYNPKFKPIFNYDKRPQRLQQQQQIAPAKYNPGYKPIFNYNKPQPEPMEVDNSNRYKPINYSQKRDYDSSGQRSSQPNNRQRINQLGDNGPQPINENSDFEKHQTIPEDLISNSSRTSTTTSSAFLGV